MNERIRGIEIWRKDNFLKISKDVSRNVMKLEAIIYIIKENNPMNFHTNRSISSKYTGSHYN